MRSDFLDSISAFGFDPNKDSILVAVSGGVDSMVLLSLFQESGFRVAVAHCNYQLRGKDSDKDEQLVCEWCLKQRIPFYVKRIPTLKLVEASDSSIQMVARNERYSFFEELMDTEGFVATALAHHADDRVESLLINILRGTGVRGFVGMPSSRDRFFRPILGFTKSEIRTLAQRMDIPFREDSSNSETDYQRNWLRLRLLPMLQVIDPSVSFKLNEFCQRVETELPNYGPFVQHASRSLGAGSRIDINKLKKSAYPFTLLKEMLKPFGFSSDQVFEVLSILESGSGKTVNSQTHRVLKDRDSIFIEPLEYEESKPRLQIDEIPSSEMKGFKTGHTIIYMNGDGIDPSELRLRKWHQGDRFRPLGMKGWKKLSDFFIDEKRSIAEKARTWLLTYRNEVVWVIGMRLDDRFKVTPDTQKVLKITAFF